MNSDVKRRKTLREIHDNAGDGIKGTDKGVVENGRTCDLEIANENNDDGHVMEELGVQTQENDGKNDKYPVNLELDHVLGKMPQKVMALRHVRENTSVLLIYCQCHQKSLTVSRKKNFRLFQTERVCG